MSTSLEKAEKLQEALGLVDEHLIAESQMPANVIDLADAQSQKTKKPRPTWHYVAGALAIAAACAFAVVIPANVLKSVDDSRSGTGTGEGATSSSGIGWKPADILNNSGGTGVDMSGSSGKSRSSDGIGWKPGESADSSASSSKSDTGATSNSSASSADTNSYDSAPSAAVTETEGAASSAGAKSTDGASTSASITGSSVSDSAKTAADAFMLTAGSWDDNKDWPFFTNLVNSGKISFPAYGIDPTRRVHANVKDASGNPVRGSEVQLKNDGNVIWKSVSDKNGDAYLFYPEGASNLEASAGASSVKVVTEGIEQSQGNSRVQDADDVELVVGGGSEPVGTQVMFILDTTGSMSDELLYLQKDFTSIAEEVGTDNVTYATTFYRDEGDDYVVKVNDFTSNVDDIKSQFMAEKAEGGGDVPEAVARALNESVTTNAGWNGDCAKIAFMIFDAPPHQGTEAELQLAMSSASERGIKLVPVVASGSDRGTELFGRAMAVVTDAPYVFLTDDSGIGDSHMEPIVGDYTVEKLHDIIVRIIKEQR